MKHIIKQPEPIGFIQWKEQNRGLNVTFDELHGDIKSIIKSALMHEQGYICCYCERRLIDGDSHIEHIKPQHPYKDEALNYANMICSCLQRTKPKEPLHCGMLRGNWYERYISPLDLNCEMRFRYTGIGEILPQTGDEEAKEAIEKLGLNIDKLIALRRNAIEPFIDESLTIDELNRLVYNYLQPDSQGKFNPFYTTIRHLFQSA